MWPDTDMGFQERHLARWVEQFPNHRHVRLEGVGHYIQEQAPDEIAAAILEWWPAVAQRSAPSKNRTAMSLR